MSKACILAAALVGGFGVLVMLVGFATPGWMVVSMSTGGGPSIMQELDSSYSEIDVTLSMSIWYVRACVNGICVTKSFARAIEENEHHGGMNQFASAGLDDIMEFVAESVIALIAGSVGAILLFVYASNPTMKKTSGCVGLIFMIAAGIAANIVTAKMIQYNNMLKTVLEMASGSVGYDIGIPYSIIITGFGILCVVISIFCAIVALCVQKTPQGGQVVQVIQPGSGVQLGSVVPGIQHIQQGYTILDEPQVTTYPNAYSVK